MAIREHFFKPEVSHHFMVAFFKYGLPSPLDIRFQRISGLGKGELGVSVHRQGGVNTDNRYLPGQVSHPPLVLERGVIQVTPLSLIFDYAMEGRGSVYLDVLIMLLNHQSKPICTWMVTDALPVKWQTGDLDASSNTPLINRIELVYRDIQWLGMKA